MDSSSIIFMNVTQNSASPSDDSHIELTYITHFYFDGTSDASIKKLLTTYSTYDTELLKRIHFVLVDDHSKTPVDVSGINLNITYIKITDNIEWNQAGARNIGSVYARSEKILMTDIDHWFREETLKKICATRTPSKIAYKFYRIDGLGQLTKGHPNTFLISRSRFIKFFGYDTDFSGGYGGEDQWFVKFQKFHGTLFKYFPKQYTCSRRTDLDKKIEDHSLIRDHTRNSSIYDKKLLSLKTYGSGSGHSRRFIIASHTVTETHRMEPLAKRNKNTLWWKLWWFRSVIPFF